MATLLSYDISAKHEDFKKALIDLKYTDTLPANKGTCNLPNTTLSHTTRSAEEARNDCQDIAKKLAITLERCIAVNYVEGDWSGIVGQKHVN